MAATNIKSKRPGETRTVAVDMSHKLAAVDLLSGTPTVVERTTAALTISGAGLSDVERTIGGRTALINRTVVFTVAGGTAGVTYTVRITATTDKGQTLIEDVSFRVN
jgi:hypothetical protein